MKTRENETDFSDAVERSMQIRKLYNELEKRKHGGPWTNQEDVIGFVHDVGELGRLVMAAEGRWIHPGDLHQDVGDKLSECLRWLFVLGAPNFLISNSPGFPGMNSVFSCEKAGSAKAGPNLNNPGLRLKSGPEPTHFFKNDLIPWTG